MRRSRLSRSGCFFLISLGVGFLCCLLSAKLSNAQNLSTLVTFDRANGNYPTSTLAQDAAGNFYGTTWLGGPYNNSPCYPAGCGTIYKVTANGTLTTIYSFDGSQGFGPESLMRAADGNFYGTTIGGQGTIFKITSEGTLTTLFSFNGHDGWEPAGQLVQASDGNFYGTTHLGSDNQGCEAGGIGVAQFSK